MGEWLARQQAALPGRVSAAVRRVLETQRAREQLLPLVDRYAAAKQAREVLDHGDQVELAARIAARHPEVGAAERGRYHVVLLDEYQDTSHAQLVLLRALFGGGHPVTAVGDPCQSIYGWRGASAGNLRRFAHDFPAKVGGAGAGPAAVHQLPQHRPRPRRGRQAAGRAAGRGARRAAARSPRPAAATAARVTAALLPTAVDEADWVADQAAALLALPDRLGTGRQAVARRPAGRASARPTSRCCAGSGRSSRSSAGPLRRARIPCEVVGLGGLLSVPEVQDVVATLRVLHDAAASDALARLLTGPRWRIGPRDLVALGRRARDLARGAGDREAGDQRSSDRGSAERATETHPAPGPSRPDDPEGSRYAPEGTPAAARRSTTRCRRR